MTLPEKKTHLFETIASWDGETGGEVTIKDFPQIRIDSPKEWGGRSLSYCPDQLFISSIAGCLLETFIYIKNRMKINLLELKVPLQLTIRQARDGYHAERIEGKIEAKVAKGEKEKGQACAELAEEYCHLIRLVKKAIPLEITIKVTEA
ncbi:MAG: OsmC family protein [Candidatus Jordarchaeaceae archaeon]